MIEGNRTLVRAGRLQPHSQHPSHPYLVPDARRQPSTISILASAGRGASRSATAWLGDLGIVDALVQWQTLLAVLLALVAAYGWSYHGSRNWRSRIIFQTNLRTAAAAGRWEQIQRLK